MLSTGHWACHAENEKAAWVTSLHAVLHADLMKAVDVMGPQNPEVQRETIAEYGASVAMQQIVFHATTRLPYLRKEFKQHRTSL